MKARVIVVFAAASALVLALGARSRLDAQPLDDAQFNTIAQTYRQAPAKPPVPEEARKFLVQAQGAVRDKDFAGAADLYAQAIAAAPWWPDAHFNRALVLSETGDFAQAKKEMERYLLLVPDAPDARAAQDHIYDWERRAVLAARLWSSVAFDAQGIDYFISYANHSQSDAEAAAIQGCADVQRNESESDQTACHIVLSGTGNCVAVARASDWIGDITGHGWSFGNTKSEAEQSALAACSARYDGCSVRTSECSIVTPDAPPSP